ncbi:MAG: acyl-CoA thioesterase [Candidatus Accumulibacter sp.]|jgi:acyl-CoA thioester hydrolase|nr:acyl-CoA thioesterase [Accumulibacter sp.]
MNELSVSVEVEVPFYDVDAMDFAWHGHYFKYFEIARCELLRLIDYDYPKMQSSGYLWPIVECHVKYVRPASYGQKLRVEARLLEYENRIKIAYLISDAPTGAKMTKAYTVQVAVDAKTRELQFVSPKIVLENVKKAAAG